MPLTPALRKAMCKRREIRQMVEESDCKAYTACMLAFIATECPNVLLGAQVTMEHEIAVKFPSTPMWKLQATQAALDKFRSSRSSEEFKRWVEAEAKDKLDMAKNTRAVALRA
jgi:hypothetical protein